MASIKSCLFVGAALSAAISLLLSSETAHAQSFVIDLTVESATVEQQTGEVIVTGTVSCSQPTLLSFVRAEVRQAVGRKSGVQGVKEVQNVECGDIGAPYSISVFAGVGRFGPGHALIVGSAFGCGFSGCHFTVIEQPMRLYNSGR